MLHFLKNNLFFNKQYGFIKGRSTVSQLLKIMDKWTELLETGGQIDVIYTDLEKAFDKVPHKLLIKKLNIYKIDPIVVDWLSAFLSDRRQCVKIDNLKSYWANVISGKPQGYLLTIWLTK